MERGVETDELEGDGDGEEEEEEDASTTGWMLLLSTAEEASTWCSSWTPDDADDEGEAAPREEMTGGG